MSERKQDSEQHIPSMSDVLRTFVRDYLKSHHTMLPATIESFDSAKQRARVKIAYSQLMYDGGNLDYPILVDVPVFMMRWGGFTISMPVKAGNECAVLFSERSLARFKKFGATGEPPSNIRFFDLSDGWAICGLNSDKNLISSYDSDNLVIKSDNGNTVFTLTDDGKFSIENSSGEFVTALSDTLGVLENETVTINSGSSQGVWPIDGNTSGAYSSIKTIVDSFKR